MTVYEPFGILVTSDDLWIVATAACCAVACAVLGCFLVLQRLSLLGDAISHAILPGLAVAFILTGSRGVPAMLAGAAVAAMLTAGLSGGLKRVGRIPDDAALGVVFSTLFALGVLLVTWVAGRIDLDPGCVLYGLLELVPFDRVELAGFEAPRAFVWLAAALATTVIAVTLFFKELRIVCFDPELATALGISSRAVNIALLSLVSATTVVSFEAVGSILVVAMLVGPAATAQLLTDRLRRMPWIAAGLGALSAIVGYVLAVRWNTSVAGMMSVVIGVQFALAAVLAPRHGVLSRRLHRFALSLRIAREDLLGRLYRQHEFVHGEVPAISEGPEPSTPRWLALLARGSLRRRGEAVAGETELRLTERGLERGRELLRAHRLWESFLARDLGLAPDHLHAPAHREEHFIDSALAEQLQREIGAAIDPHGKPIPELHRSR